jgi:hypothetical protein
MHYVIWHISKFEIMLRMCFRGHLEIVTGAVATDVVAVPRCHSSVMLSPLITGELLGCGEARKS